MLATRLNLLQLNQLVLDVDLLLILRPAGPLNADLLLDCAIEVFGERELLLVLGSRGDRCVRTCRGVCCHCLLLVGLVRGHVLLLEAASVRRHRVICN